MTFHKLWAVTLLFASKVPAQQDPLQLANHSLLKATHNVFGFTFEERTRWEQHAGVNFGKAVDQQDMLSRLRIGAWLRPSSWLTLYVMGQDARAPFYGVPAPNTLRDTMDLHEAYLEFGKATGIGAMVGRQMLDLGEGRLIGLPQWTNVARTFDTTRAYYRTSKMRWEILMVSPVKVLPDAFNKPELGERIWGTYDTFSTVWNGASLDTYVLRHSQNKIGGWTGAGTLGTNSFGGRFYGPMRGKFAYSLEGVVQTGHLGTLPQRAFAWYAGIARPVTVGGRRLDLTLNYKEASGTKSAANSGTFDQLSPANHDKFGHQDLFGWRNLRTLRSHETLNLTKSLAWNVMYSDHRLYSAADGLYNGRGALIAAASKGAGGTHVGQELDSFVTWKHGVHLFGAGFSHFFRGGFIDAAAPHINPRYFYVFQQYTIAKPR